MFFIRTATDRDLPQVQALLKETWHATYDAILGVEQVNALTAKWHDMASLKRRLATRDAEFVVADDGKQLAGMGYAAMASSDPNLAILHQLYVLPAHQGHGIGGDLVAELETCFPNASRMRLEVLSANARAIRFYQSLGFEQTATIENDAGTGQPAAVFEKDLPG